MLTLSAISRVMKNPDSLDATDHAADGDDLVALASAAIIARVSLARFICGRISMK